MRLGIDVGTHSARAAYLDPAGQPQLVTLPGGTARFPALARQTMHGLLVGPEAARTRVGNAETTVVGCTRLMGRAGSLPEPLLRRLAYPVREEGGEAICNLLYAEVRASQVYGAVVRALVDQASAALNMPIEEVVLTVPASAEDRFRIQARAAVEAEGLVVRRLLNRPAAALLTAPLPPGARHVAVIHCGGGATDVSIAERGEQGTRILATVGDMLVGGDDFGWAVAEQLNVRFQQRAGVDVFAADGSGVAAQGLRRAAWEAMQTLALAPETTIVLDHGGGFGRDLVTSLYRHEVALWLGALLEQVAHLCQRALGASGLRPAQLDALLLIGEAAFLPPLQECIAAAFERPVSELLVQGAEQWAALGAALATAEETALPWDVTPYPVGINCYYGNQELFSPIIAANTPIPTPSLGASGAFTESYKTRHPDQTEVQLDILQYRGEQLSRPDQIGWVKPHECEKLGSWKFTGLKPKRGRHAHFTVTFAVDADGILHIQAIESKTGHQLVARVDRGIG